MSFALSFQDIQGAAHQKELPMKESPDIQSLFVKRRFLIYARINKPLVCRMKCMINPSPTRRATTQRISVVCLNRSPDIKKIRLHHIFDYHTKFIHCDSPPCHSHTPIIPRKTRLTISKYCESRNNYHFFTLCILFALRSHPL